MKKINLVIQTAFLGDLILSVPLLHSIRKNSPHDLLAVVCKTGLGDFLLKEKLVDLVFEVEKNNRKSYQKVIHELNQKNVKNLYCVHRSVRSLLMAAQIKAEHKVGFLSALAFWIFDDCIEFLSDAPEAIRQMKILESTSEDVRLCFLVEEFSHLHRTDSLIPEIFKFHNQSRIQPAPHQEQKRIAIFPGSIWNTKRWTAEGFGQLAQMFYEAGYQVDLLGAPEEKNLCDTILNWAPHAQVLAGRYSIAETLQHLKNYELVISNDSAPAHMAAYQNKPILTLFGPTTSTMGFRPWSEKSLVIEKSGLSCRPCGPHGHRECPLQHHECMKSIHAEFVFKQAMHLLR